MSVVSRFVNCFVFAKLAFLFFKIRAYLLLDPDPCFSSMLLDLHHDSGFLGNTYTLSYNNTVKVLWYGECTIVIIQYHGKVLWYYQLFIGGDCFKCLVCNSVHKLDEGQWTETSLFFVIH